MKLINGIELSFLIIIWFLIKVVNIGEKRVFFINNDEKLDIYR